MAEKNSDKEVRIRTAGEGTISRISFRDGSANGARPLPIMNLGHALRHASCDLPGSRDESGRFVPPQKRTSAAFAPLFGLAPGGVCRAEPVTRSAGELLPHRFTLTRPFGASPSRTSAVCFLWHFPYSRERWALPTTMPCGVRTFLQAMKARRPDVPLPSSQPNHTLSVNDPPRDSFARPAIFASNEKIPSILTACRIG